MDEGAVDVGYSDALRWLATEKRGSLERSRRFRDAVVGDGLGGDGADSTIKEVLTPDLRAALVHREGIRLRWVATDADLAQVVQEAKATGSVAVDTEFHRERSYYPKLALVQMRAGDFIFLIDPLELDLSPLAEIFIDETIKFVFHASEQDLEILERAVGARPVRLFDTQVAAGFLGMSHASLGALLHQFLQVTIAKGARLSDWMARPLSPEQIDYAATDVLYLEELERRIVVDLEVLGRGTWALEEMEAVVRRRRSETPVELAWTRIRECRTLDDEGQRRVAARIAAWREEQARVRDVPARSILSDLAIASIARARPRSRSEFERLRGVDSRRMGTETIACLLELVASDQPIGTATAELAISATMRPELAPIVLLAASVVQATALELDLDASLIAARDDIVDFVVRRRGGLSRGWRYEVCGAELGALLAGERRVQVSDGERLLMGLCDASSQSPEDDPASSSMRER
jgi:ribonuclease D